jgi:hypothetical protein
VGEEVAMATYQVLLIERPEGWRAAAPDDVPPDPGPAVETLRETDDLFAAVRRAVVYNEKSQRDQGRAPSGTMRSMVGRSWAVVVDAGSIGRTRLRARLCTPLAYKVTAIWWPTGWEPESPLDVPKCRGSCRLSVDSCQTQKPTTDNEQLQTDNRQLPTDNCPKPLSYAQAMAIVCGLNEQAMRHASTMWYVVIAVENEPVSQTITHDASGTETTVQVRRLHVVLPGAPSGTTRSVVGWSGRGSGDCSHCPARSLDCTQAAEAEQTLQTVGVRPG